jgi:hypothetical protein
MKPINHLTAAEMANIWSGFMLDSLVCRVFQYFNKISKDGDVKYITELCSSVSLKHLDVYRDILQKNQIPSPHGFTEKDVYLNAPPLYSDYFIIHYAE